MNIRHRFIRGLLAFGIVTLAACSSDQMADSGGTGGTGSPVAVSRGSISAIGSIWVNGVEYDTTGATIIVPGTGPVEDVDGSAGGSELLLGMLVTVRGEINADGVTGTAAEVEYGRNLVGQVSGFIAGTSLTIYGQAVVLDARTQYVLEGGSLGDGAWVEVSGYVLDGKVHATYVKVLGAKPDEAEIKGLVRTKSSASITVGGATVTVPTAFNTDLLVEGKSYVEIHVVPPPNGGTTAFTATGISIVDLSLGGEDGDDAEIEGIISQLSGDTFIVSGQQVLVDPNTLYVGGLKTGLVDGARVEVEGSISGGKLIAEEVEFADGVEIQDRITTVSGDDATGYIVTFLLEGKTIEAQLVPGDTEGYRETPITVGQTVKVHGRLDPATAPVTRIIASAIELGTEPETELMAPLEAVDVGASSFTILGISFQASGLSSFSINEVLVTPSEFFATVQLGDLVEVAGTRTESVVDWGEVELEN